MKIPKKKQTMLPVELSVISYGDFILIVKHLIHSFKEINLIHIFSIETYIYNI